MALAPARSKAEQSYFAAGADHDQELARLQQLEENRDPTTIRYLEGLGVGPGSWCLEVGPGAGSIARWMARRVGPSGKVVAADLDPRFLNDVKMPNLEVRRSDITTDHVETGAFDLVHARLVLMHIPDPVAAVRRMIKALRPGGWLLIEDADLMAKAVVTDDHPDAEVFRRVTETAIEFLESSHTFDPSFGRRLPQLLESAGLVDVDNEVTLRIARGGENRMVPPWNRHRDAILAQGKVTEAEWETRARCFDDPTFRWTGLGFVAAWGRKPG